MRHRHRAPAPSTQRFIDNAPLTPTTKGLQLAIELIAYAEDQVQVAFRGSAASPDHG